MGQAEHNAIFSSTLSPPFLTRGIEDRKERPLPTLRAVLDGTTAQPLVVSKMNLDQKL